MLLTSEFGVAPVMIKVIEALHQDGECSIKNQVS